MISCAYLRICCSNNDGLIEYDEFAALVKDDEIRDEAFFFNLTVRCVISGSVFCLFVCFFVFLFVVLL